MGVGESWAIVLRPKTEAQAIGPPVDTGQAECRWANAGGAGATICGL